MRKREMTVADRSFVGELFEGLKGLDESLRDYLGSESGEEKKLCYEILKERLSSFAFMVAGPGTACLKESVNWIWERMAKELTEDYGASGDGVRFGEIVDGLLDLDERVVTALLDVSLSV
jgi:hypothetical protein